MKSDRCSSFMVYERSYGHDEHFLGWRCIIPFPQTENFFLTESCHWQVSPILNFC